MRKIVAILSIFCMLMAIAPTGMVSAVEDDSAILEEMRARAEAMVNFEWIPSQDIAVWNENPYNGKMYFPAGEVVKGMPYTLFTSEIVSWSLCSLAQYRRVSSSNYSTTAYCASVSDMRTGPVYGSCCADFVSEVFGGDFMYGESTRYCNVGSIRNSPYGTTYYNVKACEIVAGDALSNTKGSHIVWVGEVTDTHFVIYEQTPPVARKVLVSKDAVNADGYLEYGDHVYNVVTKNNAYAGEPENPDLVIDERYDAITEFKAYPCVENNFVVTKNDLTTRFGEIYTTDFCTIHRVYTNGWCQVTFPLDAGGTRTAYTPLTNFITTAPAEWKTYVANEYIPLYTDCGLTTQMYRIYPDDICFLAGTEGEATQVFMPMSGQGYYVLGWVSTADLNLSCEHVYDDGYDAECNRCGHIRPVPDRPGEPAVPDSPEQSYILGDVNDDGQINNKDMGRLQRYLNGWNVTICEAAADTNGDGRINNKDYGLLQRYLNGWEVELG